MVHFDFLAVSFYVKKLFVMKENKMIKESSKIVMYNKEGKILVVWRDSNAPVNPGTLSLPSVSGMNNLSEKVRKKFGIVVQDSAWSHIGSVISDNNTDERKEENYLSVAKEVDLNSISTNHVRAVAWMTLEEIAAQEPEKISPAFSSLIKSNLWEKVG